MLEDTVADALNNEGFLFQKYCVEKIKEAGWSIDSEEYPISENESFDIKVSSILFEVVRHIAVVECKRQDPQRKRWIFFRNKVPSSKSNPFSIMVHSLHAMNRESRKARVMRGVMEGFDEETLGYPSCHTTGVEVYKDEETQNQWKTNSAVIYKASMTVAKGVSYLFDSEAEALQRLLKYGWKNLEKEKKEFGWQYSACGDIIPIVITSAPLFSVSFKPEQMDTDTFKVNYENLNAEQCKWLVYEFPLPHNLRLENKDFWKLHGENRYAKTHIFIVNANWIKDFFTCLIESIKNVGGEHGRVLSPQFHEVYISSKK